jgi:hypothetical protein
MKKGRRAGLAIALSVAFHGVALAIVVGTSLIGAWPTAPVEIEINGMKLEDLPLGQAAAGDRRPRATEAPAPAEGGSPPSPVKDAGPKPRPKPRPPRVVEAPPDGGAAPPRPQSVRSYAPQGSRVTALMRIDRLRDTPYASVVDAVLMRLPDRRDLLEGTDLDLYRDVDVLLLATPDPVDPAVTFLAVRHHLTDAALRAALEKGARATGRKLTWRTERGRPFAERHAVDKEVRQRDERLILLAAPHLAVVTPPAYRTLILQGPTKKANAGGAGGGGGQAAASSDAPVDEHASWAALIRRIDAEDSIMPANAVAMLSGEDLFSGRRPRVVAGTRGTDDDARPPPVAHLYGLPVPGVFTATIGIAPQPFADVDGTFSTEADAAQVEQRWPALRHTLLSNPLVVLTGFSGLIGRVSLSRAGATIHLHIDATEMETIRILQLLATQAFPLGG